ncbi:MAG: hypothetical protein S4CHLAM6_12010 [Chlamydiae bacterium]|nr:hypothetical protein [Chlamydiota bacterium]
MKKILKTLFTCSLFAAAVVGVWQYYETLPIRGSYETGPINYPTINKENLKSKLSSCSRQELEDMRLAGLEAIKWHSLLGKVDSTVISDVIRNYDEFYIGDRYPYDESVDEETQSSYFYHSHRPKEHGHFHVYFSNEEIMDKYKPIATWDRKNRNTHVVAISMHPDGLPIGLFIPNQWVSKDQWYKAEDMMEIIGHFEINHPYPSWASNQWINQVLKLFKPQIKEALQARDRFVESHEEPIEQLVKNKKIDAIAFIALSIPDQMEVIEELLSEQASN